MSNKQAYVTWILCCMHEEADGDEFEPGRKGEPGFLKVWAATREGYRARVAELQAKGWQLTEWQA